MKSHGVGRKGLSIGAVGKKQEYADSGFVRPKLSRATSFSMTWFHKRNVDHFTGHISLPCHIKQRSLTACRTETERRSRRFFGYAQRLTETSNTAPNVGTETNKTITNGQQALPIPTIQAEVSTLEGCKPSANRQ